MHKNKSARSASAFRSMCSFRAVRGSRQMRCSCAVHEQSCRMPCLSRATWERTDSTSILPRIHCAACESASYGRYRCESFGPRRRSPAYESHKRIAQLYPWTDRRSSFVYMLYSRDARLHECCAASWARRCLGVSCMLATSAQALEAGTAAHVCIGRRTVAHAVHM